MDFMLQNILKIVDAAMINIDFRPNYSILTMSL